MTRDLELDLGRGHLRHVVGKSAIGAVRHRGDTITRLKEKLVALLNEDTVNPLEEDTVVLLDEEVVDLRDAQSVVPPEGDTAAPPHEDKVAPQIRETARLHAVEQAIPQHTADIVTARHLRVDKMR